LTRSANFQAVIFDMDGLVLDSESGYFIAWRQAAQEVGFNLNSGFCESLSGMPGPVITQRLRQAYGTDFDIDAFFRLSGDIWRQLVQSQGIPVKKGFYELLACLRALNLPYALATNSRRVDAENCVNWAGLDGVFPITICREDVTHPKPAPDVFIQSAQLLGVRPRDCLVLEDSPVGVAAAVAADCPCIFVPSLLPADLQAAQQADWVMQDLADVADFISERHDHPL